MAKVNKAVSEYMAKLGRKKSAKKRAAVNENLKKARKARWAK